MEHTHQHQVTIAMVYKNISCDACGIHLLSQDEDLDPDYSSPHLELGHNQSDHHSTFTLISELQNPCKLS